MLENHISLMHGIKNPDLSQMAKVKAPERDRAEAKSPKRMAQDELGEAESTAGSDAPPAKKLKAPWKCAKCGFATDVRTEFQEHIPRHKSDSSTFQCLFCGLCYTSHISLNRHLFIVHKVKDEEEEDEDEEEEEGDERQKLQIEMGKNGHEDYNGELNTTVEEENKYKECKRDSALCEHSQTCGAEGPNSTSQNNHSKSLKT
ncbi:ZN592 protein, partial [Quiscalus mexicanus]|nr:ZN592 protein [Quiscalus mexicanus]